MDSQEQQTASLHQQASEHYLQGEFAQALQVWRQLLELDPGDERAEEGMRLCELLAEDDVGDSAVEPSVGGSTGCVPVEEAPVEADGVPDLQFDFTDIAEAETTTDRPAATPPPPVVSPAEIQFDLDLDAEATPATPVTPATAASNELHTRTQELFAEAEKAHAAGDLESTRSVLSRLFILDESYEPALALHAAISEPAVDDELDLDGELELQPAAPPIEVATPDSLPLDEEPPPPLPLDDEDEFIESAESMPALPAAMPSVPTASASKFEGKTRVIAIGAAVFLLAAAGVFLGPRFFGGDSAAVETAEAVEPAPVKKERARQKPQAENEAAALPGVPIADLIARGDGAMEAGDYATAALAFGDAVRLESDNEHAKQQLRVAGEKLREQQELKRKWAAARTNFEGGKYQPALATLYRLPESEQSDQLERFKVNGWFNLGREALMRGNCTTARAHFKEARAIDADDEGVAQGLALIGDCKLARKPADYPERLQAVALRAMED